MLPSPMRVGHVHAYERTVRVFDNKPDACGPVHIVIGDGGNREVRLRALKLLVCRKNSLCVQHRGNQLRDIRKGLKSQRSMCQLRLAHASRYLRSFAVHVQQVHSRRR